MADSGSNAVSVIDGSRNMVIATLSVGTTPYAIALDPLNQYAYVTNANSGTVTVLGT